jgi:hypothetical protein
MERPATGKEKPFSVMCIPNWTARALLPLLLSRVEASIREGESLGGTTDTQKWQRYLIQRRKKENFLVPQLQIGDVTLPNYVPHIIAFNTWAGRGAPPTPADTSGLRHFTITLPDRSALAPVVDRLKAAHVPLLETSAGLILRDPAQNNILLQVA